MGWPNVYRCVTSGCGRIYHYQCLLDCCLGKPCIKCSSVIAAASPASKEEELVDEVQHRMDQVVEAAVEWHQSDENWADTADKLANAINSLLELRGDPQSAMPRRWCSIHNREEFKYESLEHELRATSAECFCGTDLVAGVCPNGHDPIAAKQQ